MYNYGGDPYRKHSFDTLHQSKSNQWRQRESATLNCVREREKYTKLSDHTHSMRNPATSSVLKLPIAAWSNCRLSTRWNERFYNRQDSSCSPIGSRTDWSGCSHHSRCTHALETLVDSLRYGKYQIAPGTLSEICLNGLSNVTPTKLIIFDEIPSLIILLLTL